jgi:hypothetical protein
MIQNEFEILISDTTKRIVGDINLGKDHHNPQCPYVGERHKHRWNETVRDKEAYVPPDITDPVSDPVGVWKQFCGEARIQHAGRMQPPPQQQLDLI